ncbi:DUF3500 domain-containing protein [Lampropedia hyalina]
MLLAARAFLASLDDSQRRQARFTIDDPQWRTWMNIHRFDRQGVALMDMTPAQQQAAFALLQASMSPRGYSNLRNVMRLNHSLAELTSNFEGYNEQRYWFTVMGEPSPTEPWGWQIEGHHLTVNYFVLGDQVVMSPVFLGSEPTHALGGKYAGTSVLKQEEAKALDLMQNLPAAQQQQAHLGAKGRNENLTEMFKDNAVVPMQGVAASTLNRENRARLLKLIELYVGNLRPAHAQVKMREVEAHLDETHFAWKGQIDDDAVFHYRIHSPVLLIEFDHQAPLALPGDREVAVREHAHAVIRTPNGNDYGKALLQLHRTRTP